MGNNFSEKINWKCQTQLLKYKNNEDYKNNKPFESVDIQGNLLLNKGAELLWKLANGQMDNSTVFGFTNENSYLGVGTSSTPAEATQDHLLGLETGGNVAYAPMDGSATETYPLIQNNKITFRAEFGASVGNFAWNEFGVLNGDPTNPGTREANTIILLNRKVPTSSLGIKMEGTIWVLILSITIS